MVPVTGAGPYKFGVFEVDADAGELRRSGVPVRLSPQPFKLLVLLLSRPGRLIRREEIRRELWPEGTYVDFDQGVNFAIKQVREALGDTAEQPRYVQTVPKRGYRFIAPVIGGPVRAPTRGLTDVKLQKALWANIAELRVAEARRRKVMIAMAIVLALLIALAVFIGF